MYKWERKQYYKTNSSKNWNNYHADDKVKQTDSTSIR